MEHQDDHLASQRGWIAHLVTRALRDAGATEISYDAGESLLHYRSGDGSPMVANLTRLFHDCLDASADDRAAYIDRFVAMARATSEVPEGWGETAPLLRPVLRPAVYPLAPDQAERPLARAFQPLLNELVVVDQPDLMAYVNGKHARDWGVSESDIFDRARANLAALRGPLQPGQDSPAILRFVESGAEYWSSYLVIDGWLSELADLVGGRPVAFLPDPTGLMVTADDPAGMSQFLEMTEKQYLAASRPLSPQAYTVDDAGRVVPYSVPVGDPLWNAVHRSEVLFASQEYAAQKQQLDDDMMEGFIAQLMVRQQPDGTVRSVTVWGEDVYGLLPQADYVAFVNETGHFTVPWETVVRETGLAPEPGWSPVRYRVQKWPDPEILARLRAAGTSP